MNSDITVIIRQGRHKTQRKTNTPSSDRHGSRTKPESRARGDRNGARLYPERIPKGEDSGMSKLTNLQARQIRRRYNKRHRPVDKVNGPSALAREFNVTTSTMERLVRGETYKFA